MPLLRGIEYDDPAVKYRGERVLALTRKLASTNIPDYVDLQLAITMYYMLFLPIPILEGLEKFRDKKSLIQYAISSATISSPKFKSIREYTIADAITSLTVSAVLLEAIVRELTSEPGQDSFLDGSGESNESMNTIGEPSLNDLQQHIEKAVEEVAEVAKYAKEVTNYVMSFAAGNASMLSLEDSAVEVLMLAKNTDVKTILEVLRKVEESDLYVSSRKRPSPRGELDGYDKGNDIERIVPIELVLPSEAFLLKYVERGLLLYRKVVGEEYGPFYVLLDKSGSMMGVKIVWAKAVALALAQRAAREGREFYIRFFDSIPYPAYYISKRVRGRDVVKLLEYVARVRANGGTDITRAILTALKDIASSKTRNKPSDIVLITDGEDRVAVDTIRKGLAYANARLYTVMIHGNNPDLRRISEAYMVATKLDTSEALRVIRMSNEHRRGRD